MTRGDIPHFFLFNRPFKPVALGLALSVVVLAQANFRGDDLGNEYPLTLIVALLATAAFATLVTGWIIREQRMAEIGLLLTVAAYTTRVAFIQITNPWDQAVFFSLSAIVIAGGAYYLEVVDRYTTAARILRKETGE